MNRDIDEHVVDEAENGPIVLNNGEGGRKRHRSLFRERGGMVVSRRAHMVAVIAIVLSMVFISSFSFVNNVKSAAPTIAYSSITNGATFIDVVPGDGVNLTVRVDDGDNNLQSVIIYSNASGSWASIYSSGALGGVASHNTSKFLVGGWTGSWTKYWFNVTANDGGDTMFQYSFTTEYVFGDMQSVVYNDIKNYAVSPMYKNATGDYFVAFYNNTDNSVLVKRSSNGVDWFKQSAIMIDSTVQNYIDWYVWGWFTYNNHPSFFYCDSSNIATNGYIMMASWNGASWTMTSTGLPGRGWYSGSYYLRAGVGSAIAYYDGKWQLLTGRTGLGSSQYYYLSLYQGAPPSTWSLNADLLTYSSGGSAHSDYFYPSLNTIDGYLVLTYRDFEGDFHWQTYDGVTRTDKGDVSTTDITSVSVTKDLANGHLVAFYTIDGDLFYRVLTSPTGTWSSEHTVAASPATYNDVCAQYIDDRMVLTVANNNRFSSSYAVYMISAPDYSRRASGFNASYNRIVFPDAAPTETNVLSNVFKLKNINSRDVLTIKWHANDIGDIPASSNIRFWTNMSGVWAGYAVDAAGNTSTIDISAVSGSEWTPGENMWWKLEILDMMGVAETLHSTDEDIYYVVTFS